MSRVEGIPLQSPLGTCRYCGAQILWARTPAGKKMPLDPDPIPDGNVLLEHGHTARVMRADYEPGPGVNRYRTHWETCPRANEARRRR